MKKIFFSYAEHDYTALKIIDILKIKFKKFDIMSFSPQTDLIPGDDFKNIIMESMNSSNIVIAFYNKENSNALFELGYALGRNKKLLLVSNHKELPYNIQHLSYISNDDPINIIVDKIIYQIENIDTSDETYYNFLQSRDMDYKIRCLLENQSLLDSIGVGEFESIIIAWFEQHGFRVIIKDSPNMKPYNKNQYKRLMTYDFKIIKDNKATIVNIFKYNRYSNISIGLVREILENMNYRNVDSGLMISSSDFTDSAKEFAFSIGRNLQLITLNDLVNKCFKI